MNWLAHLYLSEPSAAFRIGNLLPDLLPAREFAHLSAEFLRGAECHRRIDAFTDAHAVVRRSMRRVPSRFTRYSGILVDVFYDHVLAREWAHFSPAPLAAFASEVYAGFAERSDDLPATARERLRWMSEEDLFCSYESAAGIAQVLARMGQRFRRPVRLEEAADWLESDYEALRADFHEFFPQLIAALATSNARTTRDRQTDSLGST